MEKLTFLEENNSIYYVCGDTNVNLLKAPTHNAINYYFDDLIKTGCQVLIDKPTRITSDVTSLVDHVYSNDPTNKLTPGIIIADMTDHLPIYLKVSSPYDAPSDSPLMIRDWKSFNIS